MSECILSYILPGLSEVDLPDFSRASLLLLLSKQSQKSARKIVVYYQGKFNSVEVEEFASFYDIRSAICSRESGEDIQNLQFRSSLLFPSLSHFSEIQLRKEITFL